MVKLERELDEERVSAFAQQLMCGVCYSGA